MPIMESEKIVAQHKTKELSAHGFSLVSVSLAIVMICVGSGYWDSADCKLGAAAYLYYGRVFY